MIRDSVHMTSQLLAPLPSAYKSLCSVKYGRLTLVLKCPEMSCQEVTPILFCDAYQEQLFVYSFYPSLFHVHLEPSPSLKKCDWDPATCPFNNIPYHLIIVPSRQFCISWGNTVICQILKHTFSRNPAGMTSVRTVHTGCRPAPRFPPQQLSSPFRHLPDWWLWIPVCWTCVQQSLFWWGCSTVCSAVFIES